MAMTLTAAFITVYVEIHFFLFYFFIKYVDCNALAWCYTVVCGWGEGKGGGRQFSSVQDGIHGPGKPHMRSTTSLTSFPNVAFETVPMFVWLTMARSRPFKEDRLALPLSTPHSSQAIDGVVSLALTPLCPEVVSQAPQHFRYSEKQATCEGCCARQCICSDISRQTERRRVKHYCEGTLTFNQKKTK